VTRRTNAELAAIVKDVLVVQAELFGELVYSDFLCWHYGPLRLGSPPHPKMDAVKKRLEAYHAARLALCGRRFG
jgi:hypothetical protein